MEKTNEISESYISIRIIDGEISKKIYGWELAKVSSDYNGENACEILAPNGVIPPEYFELLPRVGKIPEHYLCPSYTTDLTLSLQLCDKVKFEPTFSDIKLGAKHVAKKCLEHFESKK